MEIEEAMDGEALVEKIDVLRPDLVFMDIKLPGKSGLEITKRIRKDYPKIIIIVLTMHDSPEYRQAAYQCGANYFIPKLGSPEEILELVQSILSEMGPDSTHPDRR
jgi:two-component system response regulator YesN